MKIEHLAAATTAIEHVALEYGAKLMLYAAVQYVIEQNELNPLRQHHLAHVRNYLMEYLWPDCPSAPAAKCPTCSD